MAAANLTATRIEDGWAAMSVLTHERDGEPYRLFEARSYGPSSEAHFVYRLDNRKGSPHSYQVGAFADTGKLVLATNRLWSFATRWRLSKAMRSYPSTRWSAPCGRDSMRPRSPSSFTRDRRLTVAGRRRKRSCFMLTRER